MKKITILLCLLTIAFSGNATDWFPFSKVNHNWNISVNGGYSPTGRVPLYGIGITVRGFHLTIGGLASTHVHDIRVDTWNEESSCMLQLGYQIPIARSLRLIPVIGITGVGEVHTDGWDYDIGPSGTIYNKVTNDLKYKFDYGARIVFNHRKLIINLAASRHTLSGGIGLEF